MSKLQIDLQDGFVDDAVVVRVEDRSVFEQDPVNTRFQIGLAHSFEIEVERFPVAVEVDLRRRDLRSSFEIRGPETPYLGVSVTPEGKLDFRAQEQPFGYL